MKERGLLGVTLLTFTTLRVVNLSEQKRAKNIRGCEARQLKSKKATSKKCYFYDWEMAWGIRI